MSDQTIYFDQTLSDVLDTTETFTGCLECPSDDRLFHAVVVTQTEGLHISKETFMRSEDAITYAKSCVQVPIAYSSRWARINPDHWWKGSKRERD
jgi:hypothetical protein